MAHTTEEWFQIGLENHINGLHDEAIDAFNQVLLINPLNLLALISRSASKSALGDNLGAIADCNQSLEIDPQNAIAYCYRGLAKFELGDLESAITDYNQAIHITNNLSFLYNHRGSTKLALGDIAGAIVDFDHGIQIDPNDENAYNCRGSAKSAQGDAKGAIADFDQAIKLNPYYAIAFNNRGVAKSKINDYNNAILDYSQAIEINPIYANPHLNRGKDFHLIGNLYESRLDFNCYIFLTDGPLFFNYADSVFNFYHTFPAPFLLYRTLEKSINDFDQFNTIHPITDTTRQLCRPWKRWEEWRKLSGSEQHEPIAHYHALALVNHYMGDCIEAYRIYDEVLDDEKAMGVPLNLMGLYYYIESAKLFRQKYAVILEDAIEQIEETREELIENNALRELYYAGHILWAKDQVTEAHEYFELAGDYLPAAYMQLLTLPMMGADKDDMEAKIADIRAREVELTPNESFLQGFPARPFRLEKQSEDFLAPVLHYAHYREIAQAIAEVRDPDQPFKHQEMWDAFYWMPEDEKELDWMLRRERLAEINKALLEKFKANVQSGSGVHSLEHLEIAFAQKLKHDLWEGTQYLNFEDFKSKSEAWPNAVQEVATLIRDSRQLDANSKLLLVEYCHLRGSLSIEDVYLLYFYISYANPSRDLGIVREVNSAALKKVVELTLAPVSLTGKVLVAATGGAVAQLFKLFHSDARKQDQINMEEFQNTENSPRQVDDFEVFTENFLRFISYQREILGEETFGKQYPLAGFEDRKRNKATH